MAYSNVQSHPTVGIWVSANIGHQMHIWAQAATLQLEDSGQHEAPPFRQVKGTWSLWCCWERGGIDHV